MIHEADPIVTACSDHCFQNLTDCGSGWVDHWWHLSFYLLSLSEKQIGIEAFCFCIEKGKNENWWKFFFFNLAWLKNFKRCAEFPKFNLFIKALKALISGRPCAYLSKFSPCDGNYQDTLNTYAEQEDVCHQWSTRPDPKSRQ